METRPRRLSRPLPPARRTLSIDIERAPAVAEVWGLWNQNISIHQLREKSRMVSFAAVFDDDRDQPVFRSEYHDGRARMLGDLHAVLDEFTGLLVTYNGKRFDLKHVYTELRGDYIPCPACAYKHIDLLLHERKTFKNESNKLDYVVSDLKIGRKLDYGESHSELLKGCEAGNEDSMNRLRDYNIQDSLLNLDLYRRNKELGYL